MYKSTEISKKNAKGTVMNLDKGSIRNYLKKILFRNIGRTTPSPGVKCNFFYLQLYSTRWRQW